MGWIIAAAILAGLLWEFLLICPDKLPWRRKR